MKAATIKQSGGKSVEVRELPGIFTCILQHEVAKTGATFDWLGPKISPEAWREMLAFFKWTYDTEKTESQVRLFIHPELGWKFWAFPQDSVSSMTTKEVSNDLAREQRAAIGPGYFPWGTVHHHCGMGAFQSGTDHSDEVNVDGLHITIGKLGDAQYDMHTRLYVKGNRFEPQMAAFWDIGPEKEGLVKAVSELGFTGEDVADKIARQQMCEPAPADTAFNPLWKSNFLPHKEGISKTFSPGKVWCTHCCGYPDDKHTSETCPKKPAGGLVTTNGAARGGSSRGSRSIWSPEDAYDELETQALILGWDAEEFLELMLEVTDGQGEPIYQKIIDTCSDNFLSLADLFKVVEKKAKERDTADKDAKDGIVVVENESAGKIKSFQEMTEAEREEYLHQQELRQAMGHGEGGYGGWSE